MVYERYRTPLFEYGHVVILMRITHNPKGSHYKGLITNGIASIEVGRG